MILNRVDQVLLDFSLREISGFKRFLIELWFFGIKQARACLFAGLFFIALFVVPRDGFLGIYRYDLLLIIALLIQIFMFVFRLESKDEVKAICVFHLLGFILEVFKVSIGSWGYTDFAYTKILGVPLFSGFMYASVGSYIVQCYRLFDLKVYHYPPQILAVFASALIYINFFTHHYVGDFRYYIMAFILGLYARTFVCFTPLDMVRKMPLILAFILIGFFIWFAENICTFFEIYSYPNQLGAWDKVSFGKWNSWSLLVVLTFTITVFLKDIKKRVFVAVVN